MSSVQFAKSRSFGERLRRLRNFQSKDFWAMVFARPLTILLLLPVADISWVTPNLVTWLSVAAKAAGISALVYWPSFGGGVLAAALINLGLVLDNMDGTLARYRGRSSYVGYYLDKTVDIVCLAGIFAAFGFRTYTESGHLVDLVLPFAAFGGASVTAYCKWVAQRVETDVVLLGSLEAGTLEDFARRRAEQNPAESPPERNLLDWLRWLGEAVKSILYFNEVDIFFFLALALVLGRPWLFSRVMCACYAFGLLVGPVVFFYKLRRLVRRKGLE